MQNPLIVNELREIIVLEEISALILERSPCTLTTTTEIHGYPTKKAVTELQGCREEFSGFDSKAVWTSR
jgi:hypothetical protein